MQKSTVILLFIVTVVTCNHTPCDTAHTAVWMVFNDLAQVDREYALKSALRGLHKKIVDPQTSIDDKICYQAIQQAYQAQVGMTEATPFKCDEACRFTFDIIT
ncbi:unnamed protein product [Bursaphelenchus okinawaensis]|uniref:Saposin B-type domain-containing protein n=1 Tax=Bursaphelenchus okinawaensis TaxID=465554 RepID=A0A811KTI9_9BILA|nr:unnamed protein product [Bursaphelenchus okinawaensis]CAG9109522.1 unnamed protein product [Bursaphelenchus okinawaensis]